MKQIKGDISSDKEVIYVLSRVLSLPQKYINAIYELLLSMVMVVILNPRYKNRYYLCTIFNFAAYTVMEVNSVSQFKGHVIVCIMSKIVFSEMLPCTGTGSS